MKPQATIFKPIPAFKGTRINVLIPNTRQYLSRIELIAGFSFDIDPSPVNGIS